MKKAFSLVELSIVLVILGLLVGGVLSGQSLIKAAQLRAVSTEYARYSTAVLAFRDKYFAIPGDMTNATAFWATAAACPGIRTTAAGGTCNGDGDGKLSQFSTNANELYRLWQHLALAGLIEGSYTGTAYSLTATDSIPLIGTNIPASKYSSGGWSSNNYGDAIAISNTSLFDGAYGNTFIFGTNAGCPTCEVNQPLLKPEDTWNIDTKLDDGKPATGILRTWELDGGGACSDLAASAAASLANSVYALGNTGQTCRLIFKLGL